VRRALALLALGLAAAGCVEAPPTDMPPPVRCDPGECPPGQGCIDHLCYGDASGEFAAELFAPQMRTDMLARAEVTMLDISEQNQVDVMFGRSITVSGRVLLRSTDQTSVAARVVFQRPSRIPGAPDYSVTVDAVAGKREGESAFQARILPNIEGEKYTITIYPDDTATVLGGVAPSSLAPPAQFPLLLTSNLSGYKVTLDFGGLQEVTGSVVDAAGYGIPGLIVRAWGRRPGTNSPVELMSSTGKTDANGRYTLFLPTGRSSTFELRVQPSGGAKVPSLVRRNVRLPTTTDPIPMLETLRYPALPPLARYQVPVTGPKDSDTREASVGATVIFETTVVSTTNETVTYATQSEVGVSGMAELDLLPGVPSQDRNYKVTILPQANSLHGSLWDDTIAIGSSNGNLTLREMPLPGRVHVSGRVLNSDAEGATPLVIRAQLTSSFLLGAPGAVDRLQALQLPEVTTNPDGTFSMHLDATLAGLVAEYDLECVPASGSSMPRWSRDRVTLPAASNAVTLEEIWLPSSSLVSGIVRDEAGLPVADAEVRVYMRTSATTARQRAIAKSDATGKVSLVLPVVP